MTETPFDKMVTGSDEEEKEIGIIPAEEEKAVGINLANFTTDMADFDASDMSIPRLRLAQGLTPEVQDGDAKPGQWLLTGFDPANTLHVVPVSASRQRVLRDDEGNEVLCRASDGKMGVGVPGGLCADCEFNKWTDGPKGKRIGPKCVFSYIYIVYVLEHQSLALLEFRRTSLNSGKQLNTMAAQRGLGKFAIELSSNKQNGERGAYYSIMIKPSPFTQETRETVQSLGYGLS